MSLFAAETFRCNYVVRCGSALNDIPDLPIYPMPLVKLRHAPIALGDGLREFNANALTLQQAPGGPEPARAWTFFCVIFSVKIRQYCDYIPLKTLSADIKIRQMVFDGKANEYFQIEELDESSKQSLNARIGNLKDDACKVVIWFQETGCELLIDTMPYTFKRDQVIFLTQFHMVEVKRMRSLKLLRFNRPFFCISDHDSEAGCRGVLFFGSVGVPTIHLEDSEAKRFKDIWKFFEDELHARDSLQLDMLQTLLKNMLIIATRIYKMQTNYKDFDQASMDVVRSFNFLVEKHYREKHTVAEYAALLFKSPKTLSNIFSRLGGKTPSQFIYDRIMTEARRKLRYTDKSVGDIGYHLGFTDVQAFSRFFTNNEGISPTQFRENKPSGNIANNQGKNA